MQLENGQLKHSITKNESGSIISETKITPKDISYSYSEDVMKALPFNTLSACSGGTAGDPVHQAGVTIYSLEAIYHSEGRVYFENGTSRYEYNLTDHLGNTRLTFTDKDGDGVIEIFENADSNEVLSENNYYPFGMNMNGAWMSNPGRSTKYRYNNKELNEDFGLDWYDYGARWYDAAIGRWNAVDPLAEDFFSMSSYNYVLNNPMVFIDPFGMKSIFYNSDGEELYRSEDNLEDAIVIIDNADAFLVNSILNFFKERNFSEEEAIGVLRKAGTSYMVDGMMDLLSFSYDNVTDYELEEVEGRNKFSPLYSEARAATIAENGEVRANLDTKYASGYIDGILLLNHDTPNLHTHPNDLTKAYREKKRMKFPGEDKLIKPVDFAAYGPSPADKSASKRNTPYFDIIVSHSNIYLHRYDNNRAEHIIIKVAHDFFTKTRK